MGSNQNTKHKVAAGELCYICELKAPALTDEVGGRICQECYDCIQAMRLTYALQGGYARIAPGRAADLSAARPGILAESERADELARTSRARRGKIGQ